jgi:TRAP-type C4-dicarboxylate transport system permease small subunit
MLITRRIPSAVAVRLALWLVRSCVALLWVTALLKVVSVRHALPALDAPDPVLGIPMRWFLLLGSAFECAGGFAILCSGNTIRRLLLLRLVMGTILAYRALLWVDGNRYCPCLGTVAHEWLGSSSSWVSGLLLPALVVAIVALNEALLHALHPRSAPEVPASDTRQSGLDTMQAS